MNVIIRGGEVVDGTGAEPVRADVRVTDGRISEIGPSLRPDGERQVDASGAYVTPGFIDIHTHFDASLFWDPACDPMPQHGVTSILTSSCSQSLAPCRADRRDELVALLCYIEDLPEDAVSAALPWTWTTYGEMLDTYDAGRYAVNVGGMVGHTPLRLYVMGDEAWERAASDDERAQIAALAGESIDAGAFGLSASIGFDEDRAKRPVPGRLADDAEFDALIDVLADRGRFMQFISDPHQRRTAASVTRMARLCGRRKLTNTWINVMYDDQAPDHALSLLDLAAELQAEGSPTYPQFSPRPVDIQVNWFGGMSFMNMRNTWQPMVQTMDPAAKAQMLQDESWRAAARDEWERVKFTMIRHHRPELIRLVSVTRPEHEPWLNRTFDELVAERGGHPSDVMADWVLANDLRPGIVGTAIGNGDADGVAALLNHPAAVIANSDAGAHVQMFCAAGDTTLLLTRFVRDRADMTIGTAIHRLTGQLGSRFGFVDRGEVRVGAIADLNVFSLDELAWEREVFVADIPGGARRLRRPPGGYRTTMVGGVATQESGDLTGAMPGRLLRR